MLVSFIRIYYLTRIFLLKGIGKPNHEIAQHRKKNKEKHNKLKTILNIKVEP